MTLQLATIVHRVAALCSMLLPWRAGHTKAMSPVYPVPECAPAHGRYLPPLLPRQVRIRILHTQHHHPHVELKECQRFLPLVAAHRGRPPPNISI